MRTVICLLFAGIVFGDDGPAVYQKRCAGCHDNGVGRAPNNDALRQMSPESVQTALTTGIMSIQGIVMTNDEIRGVATFVTGKQFGGEALPKQAFCRTAGGALPPDLMVAPHWVGWGGDDNHHMQTAAMAGLAASDVPKLKLKWAFGIPGVLRAYAQPTVAGGRMFIGTGTRKVYALNAATGCVQWTYDAEAGVRTSVNLGRIGNRWAAYFGDQSGWAYAVDASDGKLIWKTRRKLSGCADHRRAATVCGTFIRPGVFGRRDFRRGAGL